MSAYEDMLAELDRSDAERARDGVYTPADPAPLLDRHDLSAASGYFGRRLL